ncbi:hypothetical protein PC9H_007269 [Pleurotus ostreatus]|uniref:Rho guanine nucleotide exchange factor scd1 n=1 Tax=Pleurotus ostreatus TaxID=5322 RepID=A0A8H6ZQS7_PLEOS|nr:uncharacterized protein PC9H_007269 [Pleurotus ostreatus]KAF7428050.1 hypothetical protein PC9H_007269 [Pleurotus ostreatus]KAJ8696101.1 Guanine nucleotide exchange factor for Cdc42p [Pleurotus ostreatus]
MASVAGRKKSIASTTGLQIDTPVANNTLLNKSASQTVSLYQKCSALRNNLMRIEGFSPFFTIAASSDSRRSTDPVAQVWDVLSLGITLCFLYNKVTFENHDPVPEHHFENWDNSEKANKRFVAWFIMRIKGMQLAGWEGCEEFTISDLRTRESTDGLVKAVDTVIALVDHLPLDAFEATPPSPPYITSQSSTDSLTSDAAPVVAPNAREKDRNHIIREIVETERKYVQDLEVMQKYSTALAQGNFMDLDTIYLLFPNLNKLLNFQRKFLIRLEGMAELPWPDQRWGQAFLDCEEEFIVYEPYCANYNSASELMMANEDTLSALNHLINVKGELAAFLIKPVQRICKYPLLLDSLIKAASPDDYPHYEELKEGSVAAKRITDKINEAQRRADNEQTVRSLQERVGDWKGHHLNNFGELLLDDIFVVTKSEVDREYHVFLFEKIILCCKEAQAPPPNSAKKVSKNNSILKKQPGTPGSSMAGLPGQPQRKNTPLLLKGRIFLNNVTKAVPTNPRNSVSSSIPPQYPLAVWWRGDDDLEYFTLRCRREDQMKQWESTINRLIREAAQRRASERGLSRIATNHHSYTSNSTNPAQSRQPSASFSHHVTTPSTGSQLSSYPNSALPAHPANGRLRRLSPYGDEMQQLNGYASGQTTPYPGGPQGYPPHEGFEFEPDEDEYEDYPPVNNYASSGRGTPLGTRRENAMSMPPERNGMSGFDRSRPQTEDSNGPNMGQWHPASASLRPIPPRLQSSSSVASYASESNLSNGVSSNASRTRPPLRSQFSSTRLRNPHDPIPNGLPPPPINRSRSASQPSAYIPQSVPPPLPTQWDPRPTVTTTGKRGSGSSESTGDSSEYSPNSSSPITPYGSTDSSIDRVGMRMPPVKIKVHFNEDIFVIQVSRHTEYDELVEKVGRKIRLCGPRRDDGPLRVKYKDEDGDMVSLGSTEDVQMAFEQYRPGGQVTLFVQ